jgi:hypothetical protein
MFDLQVSPQFISEEDNETECENENLWISSFDGRIAFAHF